MAAHVALVGQTEGSTLPRVHERVVKVIVDRVGVRLEDQRGRIEGGVAVQHVVDLGERFLVGAEEAPLEQGGGRGAARRDANGERLVKQVGLRCELDLDVGPCLLEVGQRPGGGFAAHARDVVADELKLQRLWLRRRHRLCDDLLDDDLDFLGYDFLNFNLNRLRDDLLDDFRFTAGRQRGRAGDADSDRRTCRQKSPSRYISDHLPQPSLCTPVRLRGSA